MSPKTLNKGFLLRLDADTMSIVEQWAEQEFRSVNGQLQWIINDAIKRYGRRPKSRNKKTEEDE